MTLELIISLKSSLVWTTSNNKSQIIFVVLKISLCKAAAISSHWWLQQWPVRLRCSVSLPLINCLDVWLMKGKGIHFSLIHVGWWQLERDRADDDFVICMVLYICISPSLFLFSYFSLVISVLLYYYHYYYYYSLLGLSAMIAIKTRYMNFVVPFLFFLKLCASWIWYCGKVCRYICWEINKLLVSFSIF